ncbi:MAG: arginine--tRNA ligase [Pseudomonadota bacterium]
MKTHIKKILEKVFAECCSDSVFSSTALPDFIVEAPRNKDHGDLATNLAMLLAKQEKKPPREIAGVLTSRLKNADPLIVNLEIAGPGFINFYLKKDAWHSVLEAIEKAGDRFGASDMGKGEKVMVEFVSANPTGPLHIGHGRGAALGDALARVLAFTGYAVEREYYLNDVGNQMQNLGRTLYLRYLQLLKKDVAFPDGLYKGEYMIDIARDVILKQGNMFLDTPEDEALSFFTEFASTSILKGIQEDLELFDVSFTTWFSEKSLFASGEVQQEIEQFKTKGLAYESGGALWFKATEFGDEKDRVMIKEDGKTTYFGSDIAYHKNKFNRGFTKVIDIWGADHHGYVPRLAAVLKAAGVPEDAFNVILVQMVNLLRDGKPVAMSTRGGEFVTLREVIDEVGKDAARFIFLTRRSDAQLDFDLAVAKKQSDENPVYYVQYAHARICSIISFGEEKGFAVPGFSHVDVSLLAEAEERDILKKLSEFPEIIEGSAETFEPHRIPVYLMELVGQFHSYYNKHRVITEQKELSIARLYLISGIKCVLKNGLSLLGVAAPSKM